jgi:pimeloyl-ACP methyl ester carboxylesterase
VPRGNGQPVVLIPGFLAGDASLSVMRNWLTRLGYVPNVSGITANVDCSDRAVDRLDARVGRLHAQTGKRVALIGHSRGGHFAKALARRRPEWISCVVSLGAGLDLPFDISIPTRATVAAFRELHRLTSDRIARNGCFTETCRCQFAADYAAEFPSSVPLTSVYSKGDGVVWWEACVVPYARNVEVTGSHIGLAFNRKAYRAVAEALAAAPAADASVPRRPPPRSAEPPRGELGQAAARAHRAERQPEGAREGLDAGGEARPRAARAGSGSGARAKSGTSARRPRAPRARRRAPLPPRPRARRPGCGRRAGGRWPAGPWRPRTRA